MLTVLDKKSAKKSQNDITNKLVVPFHTVDVAKEEHVILHKASNYKEAVLLADKILKDAEKRTTGINSKKLLTAMRNNRG